MARRLRAHLSFANVASALALFVALSGTAWAVSTNTIGSKQLKPEAVKTSDLADDAVVSAKVAKGSLSIDDFAEGQIPAGPEGAAGPQGPQGLQGPAGLSELELSETASSPTNSTSPKEVIVACPGFKVLIETLWAVTGPGAAKVAIRGVDNLGFSSTAVSAQEIVATTANWGLSVKAICATVEMPSQ